MNDDEKYLEEQKKELNQLLYNNKSEYLSDFNLINKYVNQFQLRTYQQNMFSKDYLEKRPDDASYDMKNLHRHSIKKLKELIDKRVNKKKEVNILIMQELIHIINQISMIYNQRFTYRIDKGIVTKRDHDLISINYTIHDGTQKSMKELLKIITK